MEVFSGEPEKESIIRVRVGYKNESLAITACHHLASLEMPIGDPRDGFFYPTITLMVDSYNTLRGNVFERHFGYEDQKNATLAPLIDCHDPGRTVSREPNIHSGSLNNAEQFSIDVNFNMFYNIAKSK